MERKNVLMYQFKVMCSLWSATSLSGRDGGRIIFSLVVTSGQRLLKVTTRKSPSSSGQICMDNSCRQTEEAVWGNC
jgi:hypothetical protein